MLQRFILFLPSIALVLITGFLGFLLARFQRRRLRDKLKNPDWREKNNQKLLLLFGFPVNCIWGPAVEEVVFRAPLLILFSSFTDGAKLGILISSLCFGVIHYLSPLKKRVYESNQKDAERRKKSWHRVAHGVMTMIAGIFFAYFAIIYQSLWVSYAVHAIWNFLFSIVLAWLIIDRHEQ